MSRSQYFLREICCLGVGSLLLLAAVPSGATEQEARDTSQSPTAGAATATAESPSETEAKASPPRPPNPVYVPPRRGQPRARVGGGVRGPATRLPMLRAMVPDHVALTARRQPALLWHLDGPVPAMATLMFVLTDEQAIDPLVSVELARPTTLGLQRIDLSDHGVELEAGRQYQWSVALVTDFQRRSRDVVTFGWIERVIVDASDAGEAPASHGKDASALAAAGLWYDAVGVADASEQAALFDQIGLSVIKNAVSQ